MNTILYIIIFIMGTVFGSFFTLAIYRIPKKQDITHTHSYCPNCNNKLKFLDLIPVFSYLFLGGRCRYCKEKIRPRYLILEVCSGFVFVALAYLMNIDVFNLNKVIILESVFFTLYLCFIFIMGGIDRENRKIEKSVVIYGVVISIIYMIYLCIVENASIYRYVIYLIFFIVFLILDNITLKKYAKSSYINGLVMSLVISAIFTGEYVAFNTVILTALSIAFYILIYKIKNLRKNIKYRKTIKGQKEQIYKNITIGYYFAISNILNLMFVLAYYKFC